MDKFDWRDVDIRYFAVAASLLISVYRLLVSDAPNDDAFTYVRTAEIYLSNGLTAALEHYSWATYSIVIATLHQLLNIELLLAGRLLNAAFYVLLVFGFISIVREFTDERRVLIFAALTVLLYPQLNEYRDLVLRDIGFWSLALLALWQFVKYSSNGRLQQAALFCLALLAAATLRAEAVLYLLLLPFSLLLDTRYPFTSRRRRFGKIFGLAVLALAVAFSATLIAGYNLFTLLQQFASVYLPFFSAAVNPDPATASAMSQVLFNEHAANYSEEYLTLFVLAGLTAILIANSLPAIGAAFIIVLVYGWYRKLLQLPRMLTLPLLSVVLINSAMVLTFVLITRYMSSRYMVMLGLALALLVPFILHRALDRAERSGNKTVAVRMIALMWLYCGVDAYISFGENKSYLQDAVAWLQLNTPSSAELLTNNHNIAYFSGRVEDYDRVETVLSNEQVRQAAPGSYLALELNFEIEQLLADQSVSPLLELESVFPSPPEQRIAIYRRIEN
ncbi:MAG: hypothetical protein WDZ76_13905 [Pseudohongiellaceae bacterium]